MIMVISSSTAIKKVDSYLTLTLKCIHKNLVYSLHNRQATSNFKYTILGKIILQTVLNLMSL